MKERPSPNKRPKSKVLSSQIKTIVTDRILMGGILYVQMVEPTAPTRKDYTRQQLMLRTKGVNKFKRAYQRTLDFKGGEEEFLYWVNLN